MFRLAIFHLLLYLLLIRPFILLTSRLCPSAPTTPPPTKCDRRETDNLHHRGPLHLTSGQSASRKSIPKTALSSNLPSILELEISVQIVRSPSSWLPALSSEDERVLLLEEHMPTFATFFRLAIGKFSGGNTGTPLDPSS